MYANFLPSSAQLSQLGVQYIVFLKDPISMMPILPGYKKNVQVFSTKTEGLLMEELQVRF